MSESDGVLFDVNALVALCLTTHVHHRAAHAFLARCSRWATCPTTEAGLYRLLLNPLVAGQSLEVTAVDAVVTGFRADPRWHFVPDTATLAEPVIDTRVLRGYRQVTDLQLLNLARSHGLRLATFDRALASWVVPDDRRFVAEIPAS